MSWPVASTAMLWRTSERGAAANGRIRDDSTYPIAGITHPQHLCHGTSEAPLLTISWATTS